jgi:hypothetical protein
MPESRWRQLGQTYDVVQELGASAALVLRERLEHDASIQLSQGARWVLAWERERCDRFPTTVRAVALLEADRAVAI